MKFIVNLLTFCSLLFLLGCETIKNEQPLPPPPPAPVADVTCWDGSKVFNTRECPAQPAPQLEVCWDGSVVSNLSECPSQPQIYTCNDGTLVYDLAACPLQPSPPIGQVDVINCADGTITTDAKLCPLPSQGYNGMVADPVCIENKTCTSVDILFGTTRKIDWTIPPEVDGMPTSDISAFSEQLKNDTNTVDLGVMKVTVPYENGRKLDIPRPRSEREFLIFKRRAEVLDSSKHYTLYDYEELDEATFKESLSKKNSAFIYIHGFKEDAEVAAFKAAQISVKGFYDGAPSIFTWPSLEKNTEYHRARRNARASAKALSEFINLVSSTVQTDEVHIIAHSMGNHVLLEAMSHLETSLLKDNALGEVMLAAPDIAGSSYLDFVSKNKTHFGGITLYTSNSDKTLELSQQVCRARKVELQEKSNRNSEEEAEYRSLDCDTRAGYFKANNGRPLITNGADTIDASKVDESKRFLDISSWHSYPFTDSKLLSDMAAIMDPVRSAPTYKRTNIECIASDGTPCFNPSNPPEKHYFSIK